MGKWISEWIQTVGRRKTGNGTLEMLEVSFPLRLGLRASLLRECNMYAASHRST